MQVRDTILLVDASRSSRALLRGILQDSYHLLEAENGEQAMLLLEQNHSYIAAVLLDLAMTVQSGCELLSNMEQKGLLEKVPIIVLTADTSSESEIELFKRGAKDIIKKPCDPMVIRFRVENIIELCRHEWHLEHLVEEQTKILSHSNEVMVSALSSIIEHRSLETGQHILRLSAFTKLLLEDIACTYPEYGLDDHTIQIIASASALHDVGKIAIPDAILNKPGRLTPEEYEVMKAHSATGGQILERLHGMGNEEYLRYAYNICRYHHERWDGRGYPEGLKGEQIPICAQVVGLADAYDALTTNRVYKDAYSCERAMNMILNGECGNFSPKILECFKHVGDDFAKLAHYYADEHDARPEGIMPPISSPKQPVLELDTLQMAQIKYHTLLQYADATVIEVDLDKGIYHLVYNPNPDLALMGSGSTFLDSVHSLIAQQVHPEDQAGIQELFTTHIKSFLNDRCRKESRRLRICNPVSGEYHWYTLTILRMDVGDANQNKLMVACQRADNSGIFHRGLTPDDEFQKKAVQMLRNHVYCCRNDQWFTLMGDDTGIAALLGYTQEELQTLFQNRLMELIPPEERKTIRERVTEQLMVGPDIEMEFGVRHKNGHTVWVLVKSRLEVGEDGKEYFYGLLIDVSQIKKAEEDLHVAVESQRILMAQANDIIFEWDIETDTVKYSGRWEAMFGYRPIAEQVSLQLPKASHIHPDDIPMFMRALNAIKSGVAYQEVELRIAKADGRYLWCRLRATAQFGEDHKPVRALGVLINVDIEHCGIHELRDKLNQDLLSKLPDRNMVQRQIDEYLSHCSEGEQTALFIMNLDNFRQINEESGRLFGDVVLTEVATNVISLCRAEDIVAWTGGDEFMIFVKNIHDKALLEQRCGEWMERLYSIFRDHLCGHTVSCSLGVALSPKHGTTFQELVQHADQALHQAKQLGKNRYVFYK